VCFSVFASSSQAQRQVRYRPDSSAGRIDGRAHRRSKCEGIPLVIGGKENRKRDFTSK
jgi:hypothetical protein